MLPAISTSLTPTHLMGPTTFQNTERADPRHVISSLKSIGKADSDITLSRKKSPSRKSIASFFSSIRKVSIRCLRAITPGCMQSNKIRTTGTANTPVIEYQHDGQKQFNEINNVIKKLNDEMQCVATKNGNRIPKNSSKHLSFNAQLTKTARVIDDMDVSDNPVLRTAKKEANKHLNALENKLKTLTGTIEEDHKSALKDITKEASKIHDEMRRFAEKNCSFIPSQSPMCRGFREDLQRLDAAINDLQKDDNNSEINRAHQLIQSYHAKLNEFNQYDYPKQLAEINKKINELDNEMQNFAKGNGNSIQKTSNKYNYFDMTIERIIDRLDDLSDVFSGPDFTLARKESYKLIFPLDDKLENFTQAPS